MIERHQGILQKVARAYCPFSALRPDLVQEMTVALLRAFERYDRARPFSTWMYRIALNVAISFYRTEVRYVQRVAPLERAPEKPQGPSEDPRITQLLECIDELNALDKALVLLYLDGYPHAESAGILGITETNAATKLGRIKERLRRAMIDEITLGGVNGTR